MTSIREAFSTQISMVLGNIENRHKAASTYFKTLHQRIPIIDEDSYFERLKIEPADDEPRCLHFDLLSLCILLAITVPMNGAISDRMMSLYTFAKGAVITLEDSETSSLALLQCRLLINAYEVGHGLYPAAYVSAGSNIRAAEAMGIDTESDPELLKDIMSPTERQLAKSVWNGMVLLRR